MKCALTYRTLAGCILLNASCIIAIALPLTYVSRALAQEKESSAKDEARPPEIPAIQRMNEGRGRPPSPEPRPVPSKEDRQREQDFRNSQTLFGPGYQPPQGPEGNPLEMLQRRMQELQQQQEQLAREYQAALSGMPRMRTGPQQGDMEKQQVQQLQELLARTQAELQQAGTPLPPDAEFRVFNLKYIRPADIAQALHNIMGGSGPRIAIDERTNALLIAGNNKQIEVAEQLAKMLDQPGKSQQAKAPETLQLRIVWLLDGLPNTEGKAPNVSIISPQVVDALGELGFETPKGEHGFEAPRVVCQQLTTLTLQDNRRGGFHFEVPVLIDGQPWQFRGQGEVSPVADQRYALEFNLNVQQPNNPQNSQLGGSIFTPLGHYTVMGTTTFVETPATRKPAPAEPEQHLSAFVVYLDRAPEFPASGAAAAKSKDKR